MEREVCLGGVTMQETNINSRIVRYSLFINELGKEGKEGIEEFTLTSKTVELQLPKGGWVVAVGVYKNPFNNPDIERVGISVLGNPFPKCDDMEIRKFIIAGECGEMETRNFIIAGEGPYMHINFSENSACEYIGTVRIGRMNGGRVLHIFEEKSFIQ